MMYYLEAIIAAESVECLWAVHLDAMADYGFDHVTYGITHYRTQNSLGDPADMLILSNLDSDYMERFISERLFERGPMVRWALENTGVCSWRMLTDSAYLATLSKPELDTLAFNRSAGVKAGVSISFKSVNKRVKAAAALIGGPDTSQDEVDAIWEEHSTDLLLLNNVAHLKLCSLPYEVRTRRLTDRQREVLEWVSDGKNTIDIAEILGLTQATVEKHLRLARAAMDVDTTAQAVLKASFLNQIFRLDI